MFSPFVADLHERGEHDRLNGLFKSVTRWTLALTVPLLLLFLIAPSQVLHLFGSEYDAGTAWLRILLIGQTVNVSVGAAGFVLIMVGRTGWDLTVYASSFVAYCGRAVSTGKRFANLFASGRSVLAIALTMLSRSSSR
jgi:O-antigen/teichoic acid export membrane protein